MSDALQPIIQTHVDPAASLPMNTAEPFLPINTVSWYDLNVQP
jgi:hypothetical protein